MKNLIEVAQNIQIKMLAEAKEDLSILDQLKKNS